MKRNGMCPLCFVKQLLMPPKKVSDIYDDTPYGGCPTPPMGWSSWNTFRNNIDHDLIVETGRIMKERGLLDAGYRYLNLDDNWHSSMRTAEGLLQGDLTRFPAGIAPLVQELNALGLKVGIYSSNGTLTCEDLPATLGNETLDALTFARWGIEFFKHDFCHNVPIPRYAPLVYGVEVAQCGTGAGTFYPCTDAALTGLARRMPDKRVKTGCHVSGLDACRGAMEYSNIYAEEGGDYVLTVCCRKKGQYDKAILIEVNGKDGDVIPIPSQKHWNYTSRFQTVVQLEKGVNRVRLFNPVASRADSAMLQYRKMSRALRAATAQVAAERGEAEKPIVFSICEWGKNQPYRWGRSTGNLWRTTPDIRPIFPWIKWIYNHTVEKYAYAGVGGYNDPDMLEVGNGSLTEDQNKSHFALWCMMAAPLILGNDLRKMDDKILEIVTNRDLIAIDQDALCKPAKRIRKGGVDILARPLEGGRTAVCFFNKTRYTVSASIALNELAADSYVALPQKAEYRVRAVYAGGSSVVKDVVGVTLPRDATEVFILE